MNSITITTTSPDQELAFEFLPYFRAYKDGRVERFFGIDSVPPSPNGSLSGVSTKDVVIVSHPHVSARVFMPAATSDGAQKLPLLIYFHGGAFCFGSPFCPTYHDYLSSLAVEANVIAVSVDYRLAPEFPIPAAYEDSWEALKWVASHSDGKGPEPWLNCYANLSRVFVAGDSAGANITHNTVLRAGIEADLKALKGVKISGICLVHPDFANKDGEAMDVWSFACPGSSGLIDPRINPVLDPNLNRLGCKKVLVLVAGEDEMKDRGWFYYETLKGSEWVGVTDIFETPGMDHVFHLFDPKCEKAVALLKKMAGFINQD